MRETTFLLLTAHVFLPPALKLPILSLIFACPVLPFVYQNTYTYLLPFIKQ